MEPLALTLQRLGSLFFGWMPLTRLLLLAMLTAGGALANTIIATSIDSSLGLQSLWISEKGTNTQIYWAGGIDIAVDGYTRLAFCINLFTNINLGTTYNTTVDFADNANLQRAGWLVQNQFPTTQMAGAQVAGAAFQLALWDIMEDDGNGFNEGAVAKSTDPAHATNSDVLNAAIAYETASSAGQSSSLAFVYRNSPLSGSTPVQGLIGVAVHDGGPSPTPEPTALILFLSGVALIGLGRLRRGRR